MHKSTGKLIGRKSAFVVLSAAIGLILMACPGTSNAGNSDPCVKAEDKTNDTLDKYGEKVDKITAKLNATIDKINYKASQGCEVYGHSTCDDFDVTALPPSDKTDPCYKSEFKRDKACRMYFAGLDKTGAKLENSIDKLNEKAIGNGCQPYDLFTCNDTDPDNLPDVRGHIVQTRIHDDVVYEDECVDATTLSQVNCGGEDQTQETFYECKYQGEGTLDMCNAGACYPSPVSEVDLTLGQALIDLDWEDSAYAVEYLVECSCGTEKIVNESEASIHDVDLEAIHVFTVTPYNDAGAGQSSQARYEPQPGTCYDLDPNNLLGKQGLVTQTIEGESVAYYDQCEADGTTLRQVDCDGAGGIQEALYPCEYQGKGTSDTCNAGACYPGSFSLDSIDIKSCSGTVELDWEDAAHAREYRVQVFREISPGNNELVEEDFCSGSNIIFYNFEFGPYLFNITPYTSAGEGAVSNAISHNVK